jgi:hypothetical protein
MHQSLDSYVQGFQLLTDDALWHLPVKILDEETYLPILGEGESVKTHTLAPIEESEGTHCAPKAVSCPWHNHRFLGLQLGHCVLSQVRKPRVSETPETNMGVLLGRSPSTATFALTVVPAGKPSRGPDMSVDMRLEAASVETAGSEVSDHLAEDLDAPLECCGLAYPATTAAYAGPFLTGSGLQEAAASPEVLGADNPSSGLCAGRLIAGPMSRLSLKALRASSFPPGCTAACRTVEPSSRQ